MHVFNVFFSILEGEWACALGFPWACGLGPFSGLGVWLSGMQAWWCAGLVCVLRGFGLRMCFETGVQQANPKLIQRIKSNNVSILDYFLPTSVSYGFHNLKR